MACDDRPTCRAHCLTELFPPPLLLFMSPISQKTAAHALLVARRDALAGAGAAVRVGLYSTLSFRVWYLSAFWCQSNKGIAQSR